MTSPILVVTAVESGLGFLLTSTIIVLVLTRGRQVYHYLFAAFLLVCAIWDLGTFLLMIRNNHLEELPVIGYFIALPCVFIPALIFHFACRYTGRSLKWAIALAWMINGVLFVLEITGLYWKIEGVYTYDWGNIFKVLPSVFDPLGTVSWLGFCLSACLLIFISARKATSPLERRHLLYVGSGLVVITSAIVKIGVVLGFNAPFILPLGMFLVDIFNAIIGIAIIKHKLFDITVIIEKSAIYSALAAIVIFVFSFTEHIIITNFGELIGGHSDTIHLVSVAIGIAVMMPLKRRIEHAIEKYFAQKQLVF